MQITIEFLELSKQGREFLFDFLKREIEEKKYPVSVEKGELTLRRWLRLKKELKEEMQKLLENGLGKRFNLPEIETSKPVITLKVSFKKGKDIKSGKVYILPVILKAGEETFLDLLTTFDNFGEEDLNRLQFVINILGTFLKWSLESKRGILN